MRWPAVFFILIGILFGGARPSPARAATDDLAPAERGAVVAARHLYESLGTPALAAAVRSKAIRGDAYWRAVFAQQGALALYPLVAAKIRAAVSQVPLIDGKPAAPDVFANTAARALGPLPLVPITVLPQEEAAALAALAQGSLLQFAEDLRGRRPQRRASAARLDAHVKRLFPPGIARRWQWFAALCAEPPEERRELIEAKDRLNDYLHLRGLHLVLDGGEKPGAPVSITSYEVLRRYRYRVLNTPFAIYEVRPSVPRRSTGALGHAETEQGFLFIFADQVDAETDFGWSVLNERRPGFLWIADEQGNATPAGGLSADEAVAAEDAARVAVAAAGGLRRDDYRRLLIDSIGAHEGYHAHIDPVLMHALETGRLNRNVFGEWHETGAYLYQLEAADPRFVPAALLLVLGTALEPRGVFSDNAKGAAAVLGYLQNRLADVRFWDAATGRPVAAGLPALFRVPAARLKSAAGEARWDYESFLNAGR